MKFNKLLLSMLLILSLSACVEDNYDLVQYIHEVKERKSPPIPQIPNFEPLPVYKFPDNGKRRNPFNPLNQKKPTADPYAPDQKRIRQPLESYPLDALKFVGEIKQSGTVWGLIKQPDSQIVRVRVGDYMGQNYGRIKAIKSNSILLEETIKGTSGKWEKQITTLELFTGK